MFIPNGASNKQKKERRGGKKNGGRSAIPNSRLSYGRIKREVFLHCQQSLLSNFRVFVFHQFHQVDLDVELLENTGRKKDKFQISFFCF
jgi:hypothetical protein